MRSKKPKFFYGYVIVLAGFVIMVVLGGAVYSFGVFLKPASAEFGWTRAMISGAFSLLIVSQGFLGIFTGRLSDRFGPRIVMTACGFFLGLGYLLMAQVSAIWQLYLFYGVLVGIGVSGSFIPTASTVARWFTRNRGLMTGIVLSGINVGMMVMPAVASRLISSHGWRTSYLVIGIITLVSSILAAQFLKRDPGKIGQLPYGESQHGASEPEREWSVSQATGFSLRDALGTKRFWMFSLAYACGGFGMQAVLVHIVPHATDLGISVILAANILVIIGGSGVVGRIVLGGVADRIGSKRALMVSYLVLSVALLWLLATKQLVMLYLFAVVFGFTCGGLMALLSIGVAELFGLSSHGVILGAVNFVMAAGEATGPPVTGHIFDITNSYYLAFVGAIALAVGGLVLTLFLKHPAAKISNKKTRFF